MSNQVWGLNSSLAARAKEADDEALEQFHAKVMGLCEKFTIKESARMLGVSTAYLRTHSEKRGITFAGLAGRTKEERREVKKALEAARVGRELRKVETIRPLQPGILKVTARQEVEGRKALWQRENAFYSRALELAQVFSRHETAKLLGVSVRFLKNYAYEWDIDFAGEPRTYSVNPVESELDSSKTEFVELADEGYSFGASYYDAFEETDHEPSFLDQPFDRTFSFGASFSFN